MSFVPVQQLHDIGKSLRTSHSMYIWFHPQMERAVLHPFVLQNRDAKTDEHWALRHRNPGTKAAFQDESLPG